jgi:hypothetical protein
MSRGASVMSVMSSCDPEQKVSEEDNSKKQMWLLIAETKHSQ